MDKAIYSKDTCLRQVITIRDNSIVMDKVKLVTGNHMVRKQAKIAQVITASGGVVSYCSAF